MAGGCGSHAAFFRECIVGVALAKALSTSVFLTAVAGVGPRLLARVHCGRGRRGVDSDADASLKCKRPPPYDYPCTDIPAFIFVALLFSI